MEGKKEESLGHQALKRFFLGGFSGFVSGALLQPLQVIKTSMQVSPIDKAADQAASKPSQSLSFRQATSLIYTREGLRGFMRGLTPSMIKNCQNAACYFSLLFYSEETLNKINIFGPSQNQMIASSFARTIQCVLCNPLVVIKTRLEVVGFNEYTGMTHAFKHIWKNEGPRGFMIGAWLSLIRDVPASAVFYPIYKGFRNFFSFLLVDPNHHHSQEFNKMAVTTLASWFANVFGCIITHPIDLIRTRVYFKRFNKDQSEQYTSLLHAFKQIYATSGFFGFFRGLMPRIMRKGFGTIVAWVIYEYLVDKEYAIISS